MSLHVVVISPANLVDVRAVQAMLNEHARTYFRFAPGSWVVVSDDTAREWNRRVHPHMPRGGRIFVCLLDPSDRQGWMPMKFWDWLKRNQDQ
jgi:hypothetical protein